jgi:hypothetical protein
MCILCSAYKERIKVIGHTVTCVRTVPHLGKLKFLSEVTRYYSPIHGFYDHNIHFRNGVGHETENDGVKKKVNFIIIIF